MVDKFGMHGYTFDDVLLAPGESVIRPDQASTATVLAGSLQLAIPILSAPKPGVTGSRLAIGLAQLGGLGLIHHRCPIASQVVELQRVKRFQAGMVVAPVTLPATATVAEALTKMAEHGISGLLITDAEQRLCGIVTRRDVAFRSVDDQTSIVDVMKKEVITCAPGTSQEEVVALYQRYRVEKIPVVDEERHILGLVTQKDLAKERDYPHATLDARGRLCVGAAIGVDDDVLERAEALVAAGADLLTIDTTHAHQGVIRQLVSRVKAKCTVPLMVGGIVTADGVWRLADAGADIIKVGFGAETTSAVRVRSGAGMPQLTAIINCAEAARSGGVSLVSSGGVVYSGDLTKALAVGADAIVLGSLLAGTDESPGEIVSRAGGMFKEFGAEDGGQISFCVGYCGPLAGRIQQLIGGLQAGMGYCGAADLVSLRERADFRLVTSAGRRESHPHDVAMVQEAPNYRSQV